MSTNPADALTAVLPVIAELRQLGVRHYVCGSLASALYGVPRSTTDVDIVADLQASQVAAFVSALRSQYYVSAQAIHEAISRKACFNLIYLPTSFKVDVFVTKGRPYDTAVMQRALEDSFDEAMPTLRCYVSSPEDVVLAKLEWYRLGDEVSERQWSDVLGVMKVSGPLLDRAYLEKWAAELGVADLLAKAWSEAER